MLQSVGGKEHQYVVSTNDHILTLFCVTIQLLLKNKIERSILSNGTRIIYYDIISVKIHS